MNDRPETARIAGVRLQGESDLSYCLLPKDTAPPAAGDLVVVNRDDRELIGRVVIMPDQFVRADLPDHVLRVIRVAREEDVNWGNDLPSPDSGGLDENRQQIGGPGPILRAVDSGGGHSAEDLRYRAIKAQFPAIGARVQTPGGAGIVLAVNASRSTVNIRLDEDSSEHTFDAVDAMLETPSDH